MCHTPGGLPRESPPIRRHPPVEPVEQPRNSRKLERQHRDLRVPGDGKHQRDTSRPAGHGVTRNGPYRPVGLRFAQTGPLPDAVRLCRDDVDALIAVQQVEPPGRPGTEASIAVEDEGGGAGDRVGQRAVAGHRVLTGGFARRPARVVRTPRRDVRSRSPRRADSGRRSGESAGTSAPRRGRDDG